MFDHDERRLEQRQERDEDLFRCLVMKTEDLTFRYQEWVQQEVKDCIEIAGFIEPLQKGVLKKQVQSTIQRLEQINLQELPRAVRDTADKCKELNSLVPDDILEDCQPLAECTRRFDSLVRDLLAIRAFLDTLWEPNSQF